MNTCEKEPAFSFQIKNSTDLLENTSTYTDLYKSISLLKTAPMFYSPLNTYLLK
ncbi:MAG: hypothetical protein LRY27_02640 [Chitinophagales bacterium]|nr:hypothetical protein [Chitinophagales bacterium]